MRESYRPATYDKASLGVPAPCPVCGAKAHLFEFSEEANDPVQRVVMCENGKPLGPQQGVINEGCLLYMPPSGFYRATARDALRYWNEFADAITKQRERRIRLERERQQRLVKRERDRARRARLAQAKQAELAVTLHACPSPTATLAL